MKIKQLQIKNYKNLDAKLTHDADLIALIGNNGSGKSNLLEAISYLFRNLYVPTNKVDFDYQIEYETSQGNNVIIEKTGRQSKYLVDGRTVIGIGDYLPKKIVAIYSGEEKRLFEDCFKPFYLEFVRNLNKGGVYSKLPTMLYLNKYYWNISLLSLLVSDNDENKEFVKNILKIDTIDKIRIEFNRKNYEDYKSNLALNLIRDIDTKSEYELDEFKQLLFKEGYTADNLYEYLYLAFTPEKTKIVENIIIQFNNGRTVTDLSEGEKKLLLIKAALEFAGQEDTLFILDEPDSHIHINNKEQITKSFAPYKHNRQIIFTTHSPTLTQCIADENVYMLNDGKIEDKTKQEIINEITGEFWNKHQQNSFLASKKPIILLVEGKHDKEHINNAFSKLQEDYSDLSFEVYALNGESKIHPFMNGLYEAALKETKLYIGVYDNDKAGQETLNKAGFNVETPTNCGFRKLKEGQLEHNHFFAFKLPKPDNFTADCTIENMFLTTQYEEAYKDALTKTIGYFKNKSIDDINKDIKDKSKNILSEKSKSFEKEDFKHFRKLFDLIREIKNNYDTFNSQNTIEVVTPNRKKSDLKPLIGRLKNVLEKLNTEPVEIEEVVSDSLKKEDSGKSKNIYTEESHFENKSVEILAIYQKYRVMILGLDSEIEIVPKKDYIAFKKGKNITDVTINKKAIKIWINLKKGKLDDPKNLTRDVSSTGHYGNGDYEIQISDDMNIEYIKGLIIQGIK